MAEIPVEKKSGIPGWVWLLLLLLLLALLAWWLLGSDDDEVETTVVDNDAVAADVATVAAPLAVGEAVDWDGVRVTELTGDMSFMVEHEGNTYPVFFDQTPTPDTPTEGILDINPGMVINLEGEVRSSTAGLPENADPSFLGENENYIFANSIETENAEI